jgi:hypothetical protein
MFDDPVLPGGTSEPPQRARWGRRVVLLVLGLGGLAFLQSTDIIYGRSSRGSDRIERRGDRARIPGSRPIYNTPHPGAKVSPDAVRRYSGAHFYDTSTLRTIFLQFDGTNWEDELAARYHTDKDLPAVVTIDGAVYRGVGVRFRGNSSYRMVSPGLKRSLNLSFDAVNPDQQVGGYRTLNLLNANGDPTFVRTILFSEIARNYLPTPRVNFVRVVINGESWGVYLNAQQFNKDFLRDFYATTKGGRWKVPGSPRGRAGLEYLGDGIESYKTLYEIKSKDDAKSWSDLVRLCRLLDKTSADELESVLAPHLDVDGTLKFLALDIALANTDGYWTRASDYSIYQDERGRFHILPYDFNEAMGVHGFGGRRGGPSAGPTLDPLVGLDDPSKPLRSKLLASPALRQRYLGYVRDIADKWMDWRRLSPLVTEYQALIAADVKSDGRKLHGFEGFNPAGLQRFFQERRAFLLQQQEGNHD